jgi:hypothetical protein
MSEGRVAEFDSPLALLQRPGSIFRTLCEQTGAQFDTLYAAAERHANTLAALQEEAAREVEGELVEMVEEDSEGGPSGTGAGRRGSAGEAEPARPRPLSAGGGTLGSSSSTIGASALAVVQESEELETLGREAGRGMAGRVQAALQAASPPSTPASDPPAGGPASA